METIGSKRSYALIWCMPNNDDERILLAYDNFHETKMLLRIRISDDTKTYSDDKMFRRLKDRTNDKFRQLYFWILLIFTCACMVFSLSDCYLITVAKNQPCISSMSLTKIASFNSLGQVNEDINSERNGRPNAQDNNTLDSYLLFFTYLFLQLHFTGHFRLILIYSSCTEN